jgi:hypothetical protein
LEKRWEFRRGFVEFLAVDSKAIRQHPELLFRVGPLLSVQVLIRAQYHRHDDVVGRVLNSPHLQRLRVLTLDVNWRCSPQLAELIVRHPNVRALESFNLLNRHADFSPNTLAIFESLPNLSQETRNRLARQR